MNREFDIEPVKTYATKENARKAVAKTGDEEIRHTILQHSNGRWFPVFFPTESECCSTGIHFRWAIVR